MNDHRQSSISTVNCEDIKIRLTPTKPLYHVTSKDNIRYDEEHLMKVKRDNEITDLTIVEDDVDSNIRFSNMTNQQIIDRLTNETYDLDVSKMISITPRSYCGIYRNMIDIAMHHFHLEGEYDDNQYQFYFTIIKNNPDLMLKNNGLDNG
jgi:hypothetical protein